MERKEISYFNFLFLCIFRGIQERQTGDGAVVQQVGKKRLLEKRDVRYGRMHFRL